MPSGLISIGSTLMVGYGIRYTSYRWAWIIFCCVPGIIGGGLLSFLPTGNHAGLLAGIYLVNFIVPTLIIIYHWTAANVAGHTKRTISVALIAGSFSVGNIIGSCHCLVVDILSNVCLQDRKPFKPKTLLSIFLPRLRCSLPKQQVLLLLLCCSFTMSGPTSVKMPD